MFVFIEGGATMDVFPTPYFFIIREEHAPRDSN